MSLKMRLYRLAESKTLKLYLLAVCGHRLGLINALRMTLFVGSTNFTRTLHLRDPDGSSLSFTFRGRTDQGVLSHLYKDGVRIVDSKSKHIRTILDCGANIGVETLRFRLHHPQAEIMAVESDPDNFALLTSNYHNCARISVLHGAVWSKDTQLYVHRSPDGNPESSIVEETGGGPSVAAYSIDSLRMLRGWSQIDILKLDIEGAEHELFSGSIDWLERVNCLIFEVPDSDKPGTLQLIFEKLKGQQWNGMAIGENLVLLRHGLPWSVSRVLGVYE
jgi:FkbM family methyltransferase